MLPNPAYGAWEDTYFGFSRQPTADHDAINWIVGVGTLGHSVMDGFEPTVELRLRQATRDHVGRTNREDPANHGRWVDVPSVFVAVGLRGRR